MIILGIESSCDETAAAVLQKTGDRVIILSNVVASSASLQAKYGGVIPEQAAREQIKSIIPVIEEALSQAFPLYPKPYTLYPAIDAIAVTYGPGLIGSLLVGVETAKTLAMVWGKPLIPVNHLIGHFYANWIKSPLAVSYSPLAPIESGLAAKSKKPIAKSEQPTFPCLGLLVSGGHTDLVLFTDHNKYQYLGGTRDDAAGECFDKCARLLGLSYPGGPAIAAEAAKVKGQRSKCKVALPRPLIKEKSFDFSFSGLKTAVSREVERLKTIKQFNNLTIKQLAFEIQQAIVDVIVLKTIRAAQEYKVEQIMIAGGVAANLKLVNNLQCTINNLQLQAKLHVPPPELCTDNAAMIASAAFFQKPIKNPLSLQANPNLSL